jgi:GlpG protein
MRQVGTLPTENSARRFAAWLVSQRIVAHAEQEQAVWVVWVRDEDQLPAAREAFSHFRDHPDDAKYQGAEKNAEALLREDEARQRQARGNVVEMRGRWGSGMPGAGGVRRRAPLVMMLIGASALAAVLTWSQTMDRKQAQPGGDEIYRALLFVDPAAAMARGEGDDARHFDMWASVRRGEVWRFITPIFFHYGLMHIALNMLMLYSFGPMIEDRRGTAFMLLLVLAVAVLSNAGQALEATIRGHASLFGGMSGVCYGVFGYIFVKSRFDGREPYQLPPGTTILALGWLIVCILREFPAFEPLLGNLDAVSNTAHVVGLLTGAAIAYAPLVARKPA